MLLLSQYIHRESEAGADCCYCSSTWISDYRSAYVEHYTRLKIITSKGPLTCPRSPETRRMGSDYWVAGKSIGRKMGEAWWCSYVTHRLCDSSLSRAHSR